MDTTQSSSDSIIIGNCLSCKGLVRIPATADAKSTVRCPHCSESFRLQQILVESIPELELVTEEPEPELIPRVDQVSIDRSNREQDKPRQKFVVPTQLSQGAKRKRNRRRRSESSSGKHRGGTDPGIPEGRSRHESQKVVPEIGRGEGPSAVRTTHSPDARTSRSSKGHRSKRQNPSSIKEMFKILFGALLAFPIAYLLIMWVFRTDPLLIGPSIGNVAPFAVPAELREAGPDEGSNLDTLTTPGVEVETDEETADSPLPISDVDPDRMTGIDGN